MASCKKHEPKECEQCIREQIVLKEKELETLKEKLNPKNPLEMLRDLELGNRDMRPHIQHVPFFPGGATTLSGNNILNLRPEAAERVRKAVNPFMPDPHTILRLMEAAYAPQKAGQLDKCPGCGKRHD